MSREVLVFLALLAALALALVNGLFLKALAVVCAVVGVMCVIVGLLHLARLIP